MADKELDAISDELLVEFKNLGKDYPYITKMFMDMVAIVAEHNEQVHAISHAMQEVVTEVARMREVLKQHEWKSQLYDEVSDTPEVPEFGSQEHMQFLSRFRSLKKEDLN